MPRGDGSGPAGANAGKGRGVGQNKGGGRMRGDGLGVGGDCVCPVCGKKVAHQRGVPCAQVTCPQCGAVMRRV